MIVLCTVRALLVYEYMNMYSTVYEYIAILLPYLLYEFFFTCWTDGSGSFLRGGSGSCPTDQSGSRRTCGSGSCPTVDGRIRILPDGRIQICTIKCKVITVTSKYNTRAANTVYRNFFNLEYRYTTYRYSFCGKSIQ